MKYPSHNTCWTASGGGALRCGRVLLRSHGNAQRTSERDVWEEAMAISRGSFGIDWDVAGFDPYGSKHCLRRYLTPYINLNHSPAVLPKKVLGSLGDVIYVGISWNLIADCSKVG